MKKLAVLVLVAACSDTTPTVTDQLNLDRPVDMAFACYGGLRLTNGGAGSAGDPTTISAMPLAACDIASKTPGTDNVKPTAPGQESINGLPGDTDFYGFILQSEPGTVAIAKFPTQPSIAFAGGGPTILDANPLVPGKNSISVGENPVAIGTDSVGCREVIANAGSCDMSILDVNSAVGAANGGSQVPIVDRLEVTNGSGTPLHAKPFAMAMQPSGGTIGVECPATAVGLAYVAYPSCHLVAAVDVATGVIKDGLQWDASGVPAKIDPATITCPDECGGEAVTAGVRPVTLDLLRDDRVGREVLAIGADNSNSITIIDLDPTTSLIGANAPQRYALEQTIPNLGVTDIALSPQIGMGGSQSLINDDASIGGQMQFAYAVATDNTIHVVEISTLGKECDTQVDPRFLHDDKNIRQLSCLPVGDATTPPRRALAKGPGIELIGDAIPTSVAITKVDPVDQDTRLKGDPLRLIGYFAFVAAANGATYIINIDNDDFADSVDPNDPLGTQIPLDIAHQVRDSIPSRGLLAEAPDANNVSHPICDTNGPDPDASSGNQGGARATDNPARSLPTGSIAAEKVGALPSIQQVLCTGTDEPNGRPVAQILFSAPVAVRDATFPDLRGLRSDEVWTFTWEGSLSQDQPTTAVDGPPVREGQMFTDALGAHIVDQSKPFCDAGVEQWDIVQLRGCDPSLGDTDCPLGYTCFTHPQSKVANLGSCMLKDEADRLANACKPFLTSLRRYTVGKSASGELDLIPRKHVLRTSPVDGCTDDAQCKVLADYALRLTSSENPVSDTTAPDPHTWSCLTDTARAPVPGTGKRCIETCMQDSDCDDGTVCDGGTCMEGVIPPQACVNAPQRYELRAHDAFTVVGTRSGYIHPIIADAGGNCVRDPNAPPNQIGRIPLIAPMCDPTADPRTGKLPSGGFDANPCEETVDETEYQASYPNIAQNSCTMGSASLVTRPADAIRFRNRGMQLDFVDPTYPGDAVCIGDRGANLGKIPVISDGSQISFRQTAGFSPLLVQITPSLPVKVVKGPTTLPESGESVWVIDSGDFLSTSITTASTRGKVYKVEAQHVTITNLLE